VASIYLNFEREIKQCVCVYTIMFGFTAYIKESSSRSNKT